MYSVISGEYLSFFSASMDLYSCGLVSHFLNKASSASIFILLFVGVVKTGFRGISILCDFKRVIILWMEHLCFDDERFI